MCSRHVSLVRSIYNTKHLSVGYLAISYICLFIYKEMGKFLCLKKKLIYQRKEGKMNFNLKPVTNSAGPRNLHL